MKKHSQVNFYSGKIFEKHSESSQPESDRCPLDALLLNYGGLVVSEAIELASNVTTALPYCRRLNNVNNKMRSDFIQLVEWRLG